MLKKKIYFVDAEKNNVIEWKIGLNLGEKIYF